MRRELLWAVLLSASVGCGGKVDLGEGLGGGSGGGGGAGGSAGQCSIVAAAPLPDLPPSSGPPDAGASDGGFVTGPAVVATETGFVIGWRTQTGPTLTGPVAFLSDAGKLGDLTSLDLAGCAQATPSDGVSLAYWSGQGLYVSSLPDCGAGAGSVFAPFDENGNVVNPSGPRNGAYTDLTVAQASAVAPAATQGEYEFVYRVVTSSGAAVERVVLQGTTFKASVSSTHPFGDAELPAGIVSTAPGIRSFGDLDSNGDATMLVGPPVGDTIVTTATIPLPQGNWAGFGPPNAAAPWQTAWSNRVAAAVPKDHQLAWIAVELGSSANEIANDSITAADAVRSAALGVLDDRVYFLIGENQRLELFAAQGATGTLGTPTRLADITGTLGASLAGFDGTNVALAAARGRIVIAWRTKYALAAGDPTGGYAVLTCP